MDEQPVNAVGVREMLTDAIRYWEPRRLIYNVALAGVVGFHHVLNAIN